MNLNQFSFTKYDDEEWVDVEINGTTYPMKDGVIITHDNNFYDVVVYDHQQNLIQNCYDRYTEGSSITAEVIPNHYGSVFIGWSGDGVEAFLADHLEKFADDQFCLDDDKHFNYEELVMSYCNVYAELDDDDPDQRECYESACKVLGFEPEDD